MKYYITTTITLICFFILISCKKSGNAAPAKTGPSDLVLTATVNPDGSGSVSFTASAVNAVEYEYDFGNGNFQLVPTGAVTYKYATAGTYTVKVTAKSANRVSINKSIDVSIVIGVSGTLVWSEEFDTDGAPDPNKWGYDLGNNNGWGNSELEYYTARRENSIVEGGVLKIKAIREALNGYSFTSARLLSKGKFDFKYGKAEIRAKLPSGVGTWPAIWMLGKDIDSNPWPACGEIDIMEHLGRDQNNIYGTLHYPGRSGGNANGGTLKIADATQFHRYAFEWSATEIKIFVDDQLFHTVPNSAALPFNQGFFFILNVAMGGNFAGPVDAGVNGGTMEVDYVRVYQ